MSAGRFDFTIPQGADVLVQVQLIQDGTLDTPLDLTGWTGAAMIRDDVDGTLLLDLTPYVSFPVPASGRLDITLPAAVTETLSGWTLMPWDLEITSGAGSVVRPLQGFVTLCPEATHG